MISPLFWGSSNSTVKRVSKDLQDSSIVSWRFGKTEEEDYIRVSAFPHYPPFSLKVFVHLDVSFDPFLIRDWRICLRLGYSMSSFEPRHIERQRRITEGEPLQA